MESAPSDIRSSELPLPCLVEAGQGGGGFSSAQGASGEPEPPGDVTGVLGLDAPAGSHGPDAPIATGVHYLTDPTLREATGVALAFSFRQGGVSKPPLDSLNLNRRVGDDPENVAENVRRLLAAMGLPNLEGRLVNPVQVHGTRVLAIDEVPAAPRIDDECDAVATTLAGVPVMLGYADCVPVVLVAPGGAYCVVHSGWRGTIGRISQVAMGELCRISGAEPSGVNAYIGPHIGACCYEVSDDLLQRFADEFGQGCMAEGGRLDLEFAVRAALLDAGVVEERITSAGICTAHRTDICFSHRAEHGHTGRFAALCCRAG